MLFHSGKTSQSLKLSPQSMRKLNAMNTKAYGRLRIKKKCKMCNRCCTNDDHVNKKKQLRWGHGNKTKVDPESGKDVVEGKVDAYCEMVP